MNNLKHMKVQQWFSLFILITLSMASPAYSVSDIVLVKDIYSGGYDSSPTSITDVNGTAFFLADSGGAYGDHKYAIWKSDGTEEGTKFIIDLDNPEVFNTYGEFTSFKGQLYFRGLSTNGYELWKSDGTTSGTQMVMDIYPANSSYPELLTPFDSDGDGEEDIILFNATAENYGKELWRTDGTAEGTYMVKDIHEGNADFDGDNVSSLYHYHTISNGIYYFTALADPYSDNAGNYIGGYELWRSDGTATGTYMVRDLTPYNNIPYGPGSSSPRHLTDLNGLLIFSATTENSGVELFRSDGTPSGTVMVKDINPSGSSWPNHFVQVGDRLFFLADDGVHGQELWVTDGSNEGTSLVVEMLQGADGITTEWINNVSNRDRHIIDNMTAFRGLLFFRYNDGEYNHGFELWRSDGTADGTYLFMDIGTGEDTFGYAASASPADLTVVGNKMFFSAWDADNYRELWETDGTHEGTHIVADLRYHEKERFASSNPGALANVGGTLFFSAKNSEFKDYPDMGYELWKVIDTETPGEVTNNPTGEFDLTTAELTLHAVDLPSAFGPIIYSLVLNYVPFSNQFALDLNRLNVVADDDSFPHAELSPTGLLTIPKLMVGDTFFKTTLQLIAGDTIQFALDSIEPVQ